MLVGVKQHLANREKHWRLEDVPEEFLHVMATTMETWIISDREALAEFYGKNFVENMLPTRQDIEKITKLDVCNALKEATRRSQPGEYHKMRHAPKLLRLMNEATVREKCSHCNQLFLEIEKLLRI